MSDWEYLGEGRFADIRNKVRKRAGARDAGERRGSHDHV